MSLNGTVWAPIGPSPIKEGGGEDNGLVTTIAVNPNNNNVIYLGTAQGGVWRSTDGGDHWTPLFDQQLSLGIGEPAGIAIDPTNTDVVYVGTSSRIGSAEPDTIGQPQAGLFKSTDGGASWIAVGSGYPASNTGNASNSSSTSGSTSSSLTPPTARSSTWPPLRRNVSSDGGQNWTAATGIGGDARSLELDLSTPANQRILYAGVSGIGVFRSTDGGADLHPDPEQHDAGRRHCARHERLRPRRRRARPADLAARRQRRPGHLRRHVGHLRRPGSDRAVHEH